jgi:hypothetical protein
MGFTACLVIAQSVYINKFNKEYILRILEPELDKVLEVSWLRKSVWYLMNQLFTDNRILWANSEKCAKLAEWLVDSVPKHEAMKVAYCFNTLQKLIFHKGIPSSKI